MRCVTALLVALLVAATAAAQAPPLWISIAEGRSRAGVAPTPQPSTTGTPWAAIPATPLTPDSALTAFAFRIRSWQEGSAARVVVLAVTSRDALSRDGTREPATPVEPDTQIATFLLTAGESVEVTQTERYGAAHVVVSATDVPPIASANAERRYLNVRVSVF